MILGDGSHAWVPASLCGRPGLSSMLPGSIFVDLPGHLAHLRIEATDGTYLSLWFSNKNEKSQPDE